MRAMAFFIPALLLSFAAQAQDTDIVRVDQRVGKLESEMRAVQRKIFPGAESRFFQPEIVDTPAAQPGNIGSPASPPLTDLTDRLGELERQLRTLTGQIEANQFKLRQIEEAQNKQRADVEFRLNALESGVRPAAAPVPILDAPPKAMAPPSAPAATADAAWKQSYANVISQDWPATEVAMTSFIADWPKSTRQPLAEYWLGRSHAERGQHAQAAQAFLKVYQTAPRSPQAPESLLGLASAMTGLKKPVDACRVLGELDAVYGATLTSTQKTDAVAARKVAKCPA